MMVPQPFKWKWQPLLLCRIISGWVGALVMASVTGHSYATGYFGPHVYIDQGGENVAASPEFYWNLEVNRLAQEFHPTEKLVLGMTNEMADSQDFAAALKEGRIKPDDPAKATSEHEAASRLISQTDEQTTAALTGEFPSEFAYYHLGAFAYRLGQTRWDVAQQAWEALLKLPPEQRHYRSTWAAFMLGKLSSQRGDPEAVKWFQLTRQMAKAGFADSLGLAADSYGWEAQSEWKQNHPEKAAALYLTQLALGDQSAIVSLKVLIPDRQPIDGMLNYGPAPDEKEVPLRFQAAAKDPLLRRLVTAHILATESCPSYQPKTYPDDRCERWLQAINEAHLGQVSDAEYIGWVAYNNGNYSAAARWLALAPNSDSSAACWLRAKLQRRDGNLTQAMASMAQAYKAIHAQDGYVEQGDSPNPALLKYDYGWLEEGDWSFEESAAGDLGAFRLEHNDFVPALDAFLKGGLWEDAAFVAERVLTTQELTAYVDQLPPHASTLDSEQVNPADRLRYLLGRRLVRECRYEEAAHYLKAPYDQILKKYVEAMKEGGDESRPKSERARAWFTAAWIARYDGMELMGTEEAPDGFFFDGDFEPLDLAKEQLAGAYTQEFYGPSGGTYSEQFKTVPITLKPSRTELQRLEKNQIVPNIRYHYRMIAGDLAVRAAELMPDNSEELADVLNTAGLWIKESDDKTGNRYYWLLEKRCPTTTIGSLVVSKHWFVDQSGPWSQQQQADLATLHHELGLEN